MKKISEPLARKHGYKARTVALSCEKPKNLLTFETTIQSYLWITDRGRSRLVKH